MRVKAYYLLFFTLLSLMFVACKNDDEDDGFSLTPVQQTEYVNSWVYHHMYSFYYWDKHLPSRPDYSKEPQNFFKSLLYKYNTLHGDRFSWLQDNYIDLLNALSGNSVSDVGFDYAFAEDDDENLWIIVLYVKPNTDAERKGIKRGMDILTVDGVRITNQNYETIIKSGKDKYKFGVYNYPNNIKEIEVNSEKNYAENPILLDTIYDFNSKNTGYVVYNFFAPDKGDETYSYDRQLADIFRKFQQNNVVNLILDLRYNNGGATESAQYLASALVAERKTDNIFASYEYNAYLMGQLDKEDRTDYFADKINNRYEIPRFGDQLENIYIITSRWTASASELIINGLNPYIGDKIVRIGETTVGKNVASVTFIETDEKYKKYNKYGLQPIVAKVSNANSFAEYPEGFTPDYEMNEFMYSMYDFGNINEPLLATALRLIADGEFRSSPLRSLPFTPRVLDKKKTATDYNMYINPEKLKDINFFE